MRSPFKSPLSGLQTPLLGQSGDGGAANPGSIVTSTSQFGWGHVGVTQAYSDLGVTAVDTDGSSIRQVDAGERSLSGYAMTTGSGAEPTLQTRDGVRVMRTNGVDQYIETPFVQSQPLTTLVVGYNIAGTQQRIMWSASADADERCNLTIQADGSLTIYAVSGGPSTARIAPVVPLGFFCIMVHWNGAATWYQVNGGERVPVGDVGSTDSGGFRIGADSAATPGNFTPTDTAAWFVAFEELTTSELDRLMAWGMASAGLTVVYDTDAFSGTGQSNSTAREPFDGGIDYPTDGTILQIGRAASPLTSNSDGEIINAARPLDHVSQPQAGGMGFLLQFALDYRAANPSKTLTIIPCGQGGTSYVGNHWNKGDNLYEDAVTRTTQYLADNPNVRLKGVLRHQGENDRGSSGGFQIKQDAHIYDYRADISTNENLPFVVGGLVPDLIATDAGAAVIQTAIEGTPERITYTAYASSDGLTDSGDDLHFDAASHRILGSRYYAAYLAAKLNSHDPSVPDAPTGLAATGAPTVANLTWTAPPHDGYEDITDYVVEYSSDAGATWTTFSDGTSTGTTATVTGLTNGTEYTFRVSAFNSVGAGDPSSTATATPAEITSPADIPGLVAWFDASDEASITDTAGVVTSWEGKSPTTLDATSIVGREPTTGADTINGKNVLTHNDDYLQIDDLALDCGSLTVVFIGEPAADTLQQMVSCDDSSTRNFQLRIDSNNNARFVIFEGSSVLVAVDMVGGAGEAFFAATSNGGEVVQYIGTDGTSQTTSYSGTPNTQADAKVFIGARQDSTSDALQGPTAEVMIYNRAIAPSEMAALQSLYVPKWDV